MLQSVLKNTNYTESRLAIWSWGWLGVTGSSKNEKEKEIMGTGNRVVIAERGGQSVRGSTVMEKI